METAFPRGNAVEQVLFVFVDNLQFVTLNPIAVGRDRKSLFAITSRAVKVGSGFVVGRRDDQVLIIEA